MKLLCPAIIALAVAAAAPTAAATRVDTAGTDFAATQTDSLNRAVAVVMGAGVNEVLNQLLTSGVQLDRPTVAKYIEAYLCGAELGFTRQSGSQYVDSVLYANAPAAVADSVSVASQQGYIESMAQSPGAVQTPSGLVFIVMTEGEGAMPTITDKVDVQYTARLSDGTVFDQTDGAPITFDVAHVVPGFSEGLQLMKPGGTYRVIIPASLGYGAQGIPGIIPGNAALDFTVTLAGVHPAE